MPRHDPMGGTGFLATPSKRFAAGDRSNIKLGRWAYPELIARFAESRAGITSICPGARPSLDQPFSTSSDASTAGTTKLIYIGQSTEAITRTFNRPHVSTMRIFD